MGSLFAYSGLTTKVKAMQGKLLSYNDYVEMAGLLSVSEVVNYLKSKPGYEKVFASVNPNEVHRGTLERMLDISKFMDFAKIYNFSAVKQRRYLELYFLRDETVMVKKALRNMDNNEDLKAYESLEELFNDYSTVNLRKLLTAANIDELLEVVKNAPYYANLRYVYDSYADKTLENKLFDYELALDMFFFNYIWKKKDKYYKKDELEAIKKSVGTEIDLLNIMWMYRAKKSYNLDENTIYGYLIPIHYKLTADQIKEFARAGANEFMKKFESSYYGKMYKQLKTDSTSFNSLFNKALDKVMLQMQKEDPYSLSTVISYLHFKEREVKQIITITECVRYKYPADEIIKQIV